MTSRSLAAVVPAAGAAARLQPLPGSKEALVVGGRPLLDYLFERLRNAGCEDIVVVTREEKRDVIALAEQRGARVVVGAPATAAESFALGARALAPDTTLLLGFPDTIWEPVDGFCRLLDVWTPTVDAVLGLFRTPDLARSDVVVVDADGRVRSVVAKPSRPASDLIWGCAVVRAGTAAELGEWDEAAALLDHLARAGRVLGTYLSDEWLDVGTPEALALARAGNLE